MKEFIMISLIVSQVLLASVQAKTFKIATSAPDGSYWMKQMRTGAEEVKKQTQGRVKFKFYTGGVMGSQDVVLKKIRVRQLQGAAVTSGVLEKFYPDSQIYALPMLFNTFEEVDYIRKHLDERIIEGLDKNGMVSFGLSEGGFAFAMSTDPITNITDLNSHKIWTPSNNKQAEITLQSFGITPIPLNIGDVLVGLQTNLIDTVAVSPIVAIALQWHTQIKYITDIPLTYLYATIILDKKEFNKISKKDQDIVKDILSKTARRIEVQNRKDNILAFKALENQGIEVLRPKNTELKSWYKKGKIARETLKNTSKLSKEIIIKVNELLAKFRQQEETLGAVR